jgi:5'-phosphate synthase pdxT subunit
MTRIGVLALQGDFEAHRRALARAGAEAVPVRRSAEQPWFERLGEFHARGGAMFGTCAGAILLAREVLSPPQPSLGLLDVVVERNAWGRQVDSFETEIAVEGYEEPLEAVFIRAPRIHAVGRGVEVLARHDGSPVLVRSGRVLAGVFHPELTSDDRLHRDFVRMAQEGRIRTEETIAKKKRRGLVSVERRM